MNDHLEISSHGGKLNLETKYEEFEPRYSVPHTKCIWGVVLHSDNCERRPAYRFPRGLSPPQPVLMNSE